MDPETAREFAAADLAEEVELAAFAAMSRTMNARYVQERREWRADHPHREREQ